LTDSKSSRGAAGQPPRQSFAALRDSGFRSYFIYSALAMMADSIEHVISYWMLYQKFHSPALAGFQVISHWVPCAVLGAHCSLGLSAAALCVGTVFAGAYALGGRTSTVEAS